MCTLPSLRAAVRPPCLAVVPREALMWSLLLVSQEEPESWTFLGNLLILFLKFWQMIASFFLKKKSPHWLCLPGMVHVAGFTECQLTMSGLVTEEVS